MSAKQISVVISDAVTGEKIDECAGPLNSGRCPRAAADGAIPCAGRRVMPLRGTSANGYKFAISGRERNICPLAWAVDSVVLQ